MFARISRLSCWSRDDRGATALEFALILPVLITFLIGVIQVGWAMHCAASVRWALEKDVRTVLLAPTTTADQLKQAMVADLNGLAKPQSLTVTLVADSSNSSSAIIKAKSAFVYDLWIPFLPTRSLNFTATTFVPTA